MGRKMHPRDRSFIADYTRREALKDAQRYIDAQPFLASLKINSKYLTYDEQKALRGKALSGDVVGAEKDLAGLISCYYGRAIGETID